jgi:hypothetical protein
MPEWKMRTKMPSHKYDFPLHHIIGNNACLGYKRHHNHQPQLLPISTGVNIATVFSLTAAHRNESSKILPHKYFFWLPLPDKTVIMVAATLNF